MMSKFVKDSPGKFFDLADLRSQHAQAAPADFKSFWQDSYQQTLSLTPKIQLKATKHTIKNWQVFDIQYSSTDNLMLGGWLLLPRRGTPERGFIVGHGYGGRDWPDEHLPFENSAILFPCLRGISKSKASPISPDPQWHVLHNIDKKKQYIIKGCVEDVWLAISCMEQLYPNIKGRLGYLGISFSGGVGALAMACEKRIARAHFNVPTFGDHRARLRYPTWGSGKSVQNFFKKHPRTTLKTLRYYDAANAAENISMPTHFALALKDPIVTPPGQFAIYNAVPGDKQLFVLDEGHSNYPRQQQQHKELNKELEEFFNAL